MLKLLLYTTLFNVIVSVSCFAQTSPIESKPHLNQSDIDRLLKKSKNQKITAWSMLGGGTLFVTLAVVGYDNQLKRDYEYSLTLDILLVSGFLSMVGSVPFFITSGINKRKARAMVGTTYYPNPTAPTHLKAMPSAGIQITLR